MDMIDRVSSTAYVCDVEHRPFQVKMTKRPIVLDISRAPSAIGAPTSSSVPPETQQQRHSPQRRRGTGQFTSERRRSASPVVQAFKAIMGAL